MNIKNTIFDNRISAVANTYVNEHYPESKLEDGLYSVSDLYDGLSESFIEGYKQGRKDAIESACRWLTNHITPLVDNTQRIALVYEVIKNFRKTMEDYD